MNQSSFPISPDNPLISKQYQQLNYKIVDGKNYKDKICYIFFSGNGLYYPNTEKEFVNTIIKKDRYEWSNVSSSKLIMEQVSKIIFVRDVYKTWYVKGINTQINSIKKLCELLKKITEGLKIITIGNSAGGFIASIVGVYLHAEHVISFGGQWNLDEELNEENIDKHYFFKNENKEYIKYYNILNYIKSDVPIFWFCSYKNHSDNLQLKALLNEQDIQNIYTFKMNSDIHGFMMPIDCTKVVISFSTTQLLNIHKLLSNRLIGLNRFAYYTLDSKTFLRCLINNFCSKHKTLQRFHISSSKSGQESC